MTLSHMTLSHTLSNARWWTRSHSLQRKTEERLSLTLSLTHTHLGNRRRDDTSKTSSRTACCKHLLAPRSNQPSCAPRSHSRTLLSLALFFLWHSHSHALTLTDSRPLSFTLAPASLPHSLPASLPPSQPPSLPLPASQPPSLPPSVPLSLPLSLLSFPPSPSFSSGEGGRANADRERGQWFRV